MLDILRDYLEANNRKIYIVEIGAGCPLAQGLYECPGASRVVYHSESPYGSAKDLYGSAIGNHRMVSKEAVQGILDSIKDQVIKPFNMIVATSFQIRSGADDTRVPHGWVGISTLIEGQWIDELHHLTITDELGNLLSRSSSITEIGREIQRIIVGEVDTRFVDISEDSSIFKSNGAVFYRNMKPFRLEDISRDYRRIVLYKGSFNPLHYGHVEIAKAVQDEDALVILAISKKTYSKDVIDISSLIKRICAINLAGFVVAVFENGYFFDNLQYLKNRTGLQVDLAMGVDTFNRLIKCYDTYDFSPAEEYNIFSLIDLHDLSNGHSFNEVMKAHKSLLFNMNFTNTGFHVFGRNQDLYKSDILVEPMFYREFDCQVSSSEIRQLEASGDTETANKLRSGGV